MIENNIASLPKRLSAMFYDGLLVLAICMTGTGLVIALHHMMGTTPANGASNDAHYSELAVQGPLFQLYILTLVVGFFVLFWRRSGQTLGMQSWRLKVQSNDGSRLTYRQCLLRLTGGLLSLLCLGLGHWILLLPSCKKTWPDTFSNSQIIQLPKPKK